MTFNHFKVYPVLGEGTSNIEWEATEGAAGEVHLYRSELGTPGSWTRINQTAQPLSGVFWDRTVPKDDAFAHHYYRGLIAPSADPTTWLRGESVSALDGLTRREHLMLKAILRREWRDMVRGNGLEAWHCIPLDRGEPAAGVDPETGIRLKAPCPGDPAFGFGQDKAGGFGPPLLTRVRFLQIGGMGEVAREGEQGYDQEKQVMLRLMAFPRPRAGHMICLGASDRRYVLDDPIQPFWFKADHAVTWECPAKLLDRRDPRYLLPMPGILREDQWFAESLQQPLMFGGAILYADDQMSPLAGPAE